MGCETRQRESTWDACWDGDNARTVHCSIWKARQTELPSCGLQTSMFFLATKHAFKHHRYDLHTAAHQQEQGSSRAPSPKTLNWKISNVIGELKERKKKCWHQTGLINTWQKLFQLSCFTYIDSEKRDSLLIALQRARLALGNGPSMLTCVLVPLQQPAPSCPCAQNWDAALVENGPKPEIIQTYLDNSSPDKHCWKGNVVWFEQLESSPLFSEFFKRITFSSELRTFPGVSYLGKRRSLLLHSFLWQCLGSSYCQAGSTYRRCSKHKCKINLQSISVTAHTCLPCTAQTAVISRWSLFDSQKWSG